MSGKSTGVPGDNPKTPTDALGTILGEFEGTPKTEVTFDELLEVAAGAGMTERRGHRLRVYGIVLVVLGVVVSYAWIFTGMLSSDQVRRVPGYESASTPTSRGTLDDLAAPSSALSPQQEVALSELSDAAWVSKVAQRTGIPQRALVAYTGAALVLEQESPECGLGWNTLAGIGAVESHHGSIDESYLQANGYPSGRIIGVSLDGGQDIARIPDTDKGMFDGDSQWDRAVGPMQFIPSTWARWAADGNADGIADPQHIDDAVLAAARYLCSAGGDMSVPDNWVAAVTSYNHSIDYNNRVAEQAQYYKELAEAEDGAESEG